MSPLRCARGRLYHEPVTLNLSGVRFRRGPPSDELRVAVGLESDQPVGAAQITGDRRHAEERQVGGDALVTRRAQHPRGDLQGWALRDRQTAATTATATTAPAAAATATITTTVVAAALRAQDRGNRRSRLRLIFGHFSTRSRTRDVRFFIYLSSSLSHGTSTVPVSFAVALLLVYVMPNVRRFVSVISRITTACNTQRTA